MRWLLSSLMLFGMLLAWTAYAYADGGGKMEPPNTAALLIGSVLSSLVVYLGHRLVRAFEDKTGIDVPEREENLLDKWVDDGVALAEEKARVLIGFGKEKMSSTKKSEIATNYAMDRIDKAGMRSRFPSDVVSKKTDAKVHKTRTTK